jgi:hypothetical protein
MTLKDSLIWYIGTDGKINKWMRGQPAVATFPGAPENVDGSLTGTTAVITWSTPLDDGGSPITSYRVTRVGGTTQTVGATVFSATFTGLSATTYTFSVVAVNDVGPGPASTVTVSPVSPTNARFPGDPRPKISGKWIFGLDESDQDPTRIGPGERAAPETIAGVPVGAMRSYHATNNDGPDASGVLSLPNGSIATRIRQHHAKGRLAYPSITFSSNLAGAGDGRNNTDLYNFVVYCEEQLNAPVWFTCQHEVDDPAPAPGLEFNWGRLMKTVRWQMNKYADANGGVGVYKWKNLALSFILTGSGYARGDQAGAVGPLWRAATYTTGVSASAGNDTFTANNHMLTDGCKVKLLSPPAGAATGTDYYIVQSTSNTLKLSTTRAGSPINITADGSGISIIYKELFDFASVDSYQFPLAAYADSLDGRTGFPMWQGNFVKANAWVIDPAHTYPLAITETGVHYNDADAGDQLSIFVNKCLDGTHDFIACLYFNSHGNGSRDPNQWCLWNERDDSNAFNANSRLLDKYVGFMTDRAVHYYDLTSPAGTKYPRPAGV